MTHPDTTARPPKNRMIALLLSLMLGLIGADRFYLGKRKSALLKMMTFGGLGMWWFFDGTVLLLDAFLWSLGRQTGFTKDAAGRDLRYGLSLYRLNAGRVQRDWFNGAVH